MFTDGNLYNSYSLECKKLYGSRIQKLSVDAGFTCPNRDGRKGVGGCTFCNNEAFNPSYCRRGFSISEQIEEGKKFHAWRYRKAALHVAYFQTYSNTYATIDVLKTRYEEALSVDGIIGIVIGTRPDCINKEILSYLSELSEKYYIRLEIGIESCYDNTLSRINRGHDSKCTVDAFKLASDYGLSCGSHIILGLPGESRDDMIEEAKIISTYPALDSLKLHQLQIIKNTAMEKEYALYPERFSFFSVDEYADLVVDFLENLSPDIKIERMAGEVPPRFQAGPCFNLRSEKVTEKIIEILKYRKTYQGRLFVKK